MKLKIQVLATAMSAFLLANAPEVRILSASQLRKLIPGKQIVSGPKNDSVELFFADGRYKHFFSNLQASGTYTFSGNELCARSIKDICSKVAKDKKGNYYFISSNDSFRRPYRVTITDIPKEK